MRNDKLNSKPSSEAMSMTGRRRLPQRSSESRFLADQAANARTAMSQTLCDMKKNLKGMGDVSLLVKQHPWFATGSAVAAGFVTGVALTPTRGKKLRKRGPNSEAELQANFQGQETAKKEKSFLFSTFGIVLMGILKTVVQGLLAEAVVAKDRVETSSPRDPAGDACKTDQYEG